MRGQLEPARPGETLRDVLARIGPAEIGAFLKDGPGFRLHLEGREAAVQRTNEQASEFRLAGTGLVCRVEVELCADLGLAVQSVTMTNESSDPSPPIREIDAFHLPLEVTAGDCPRAGGFGGGLTDGFYPPRSYRPEEVTFGEARQWVPAERTFHRWWVGKGRYELESVEAG